MLSLQSLSRSVSRYLCRARQQGAITLRSKATTRLSSGFHPAVSTLGVRSPPKTFAPLSESAWTLSLGRTLASEMSQQLRELYPPIEPYETGLLQVNPIHHLHYEQCGNPNGKPVIFVHGGPGGGCDVRDRQYFDPAVYRVVLFDQRGAGKSTPAAELRDNTTWDLVEDIEKIRGHLSIEKWVVFGGSWGSTLALAYAESYPERVKALILRGIFTLRRKELLWFYQEGASFLFPEAWDKFVEPIPIVERHDLMSAYYRRLTGSDENERLRCAQAWSVWELSTSRLYIDPEHIKHAEEDTFCLQFARIECHYFVHGGFFSADTQLLDHVDRIRHIPTTIVQGRYDVVCPATTAWELYKRFPEAEFTVISDAGHSAKEAGTTSALVAAADKYKTL